MLVQEFSTMAALLVGVLLAVCALLRVQHATPQTAKYFDKCLVIVALVLVANVLEVVNMALISPVLPGEVGSAQEAVRKS